VKNVDNYQEMPILNKNSFPHITSYGIEIRKHYNRAMTDHWIFTNGLFWYVEVESIHSFNEAYLDQALLSNTIEFIRNNTVTLIISNYGEADVSIIEPIYEKIIKRLSLPETSVLLLTGARDIEPEIARISSQYNKKPIQTILTGEFEGRISQKEKNNQTSSIKNITPSKKFICLNRQWRTHRPLFVSLLIVNDLLKYGYVSLIEEQNEHNNWKSAWSKIFQDFPYYEEILTQHRDKIEKSTPLIIDKNNLSSNPDWHDPNPQYAYNDCYFSVVCETFFKNTNTRFLTEKTYKTIVHKHPFILMSVPKSLEYFREKGYKTFHPYIDESYDLEMDDQKRIQMILFETKRLCKLSQQELETLLIQTKEICDYNYELLMNKKSFSTLLVDNK